MSANKGAIRKQQKKKLVRSTHMGRDSTAIRKTVAAGQVAGFSAKTDVRDYVQVEPSEMSAELRSLLRRSMGSR